MIVSIIIPCYNGAKYFQEAIDSLKDQTHSDIEIIAVMDGPIDNSRDIAIENRLTVIDMPENGGIPKAFNKGLEFANGEFVICMSQDDLLAPTYIEKCLEQMDMDVGVVCTGMRMFGAVNQDLFPIADWNLANLSKNNQIYGTSMVRMKCFKYLGGWDLKAEHYSDWEMWCRICQAGWKLRIVNEPLFLFRKHDNNISNKEREDLKKYIREKYEGIG